MLSYNGINNPPTYAAAHTETPANLQIVIML